MASMTLAQREHAYGHRICVIAECGREYVPQWRGQEACGQSCAVKLGWQRGRYASRPPEAAAAGGRKAGQTKRRRAIARLAAELGSPVTERDYLMYRLGWKHCLVTNHGSWLKVRTKQKARLQRRAPHMIGDCDAESAEA